MNKFAFTLLFAVSAASAAVYKIDPVHSSAEFSVRHMMVSNVKGQFSKVTGNIEYDPSDLASSKIEASIDTSTIDTREPKRDEHLKSPDFLDVSKYPAMTFKSTSFERSGDKIKILGDLTIHGISKPVTLMADPPSAEVKDPMGNIHVGTSATTRIQRKDWGLVWNKALDAGGVMVGDELAITLDIEAVKAKASK